MLEIYWPQSSPFHVEGAGEATVLTQSGGATDSQAEIHRAIYLRLPPDARLWKRGQPFVEAEPEELRAALG